MNTTWPAARRKSCRTKPDIYKALDLEYVPPELREDTGEIDAAEKKTLPHLLELADIHGVFHNHTTWSRRQRSPRTDGRRRPQARLTNISASRDHSQSLIIANGLKPERVHAQQKEIDTFNAKQKGFRIFKGAEVRHPRRRLASITTTTCSPPSITSSPAFTCTSISRKRR